MQNTGIVRFFRNATCKHQMNNNSMNEIKLLIRTFNVIKNRLKANLGNIITNTE